MGVATVTDCGVKATIGGPTPECLWHYLLDHGVPRSDIDGEPTKFLLTLYKQECSRSGEQSLI